MSELGLIKRVYKILQKNLFKQRIEMIFFKLESLKCYSKCKICTNAFAKIIGHNYIISNNTS